MNEELWMSAICYSELKRRQTLLYSRAWYGVLWQTGIYLTPRIHMSEESNLFIRWREDQKSHNTETARHFVHWHREVFSLSIPLQGRE
jgi:hypothetical protein